MPGDHGAHGRFDREATSSSVQLWLTLHRGAMTATALVAVVIAGTALAVMR